MNPDKFLNLHERSSNFSGEGNEMLKQKFMYCNGSSNTGKLLVIFRPFSNHGFSASRS